MCVKAVLAVADLKRKDVNLELIKARARAGPRRRPPALIATAASASHAAPLGMRARRTCRAEGRRPRAGRAGAGPRRGARTRAGGRQGRRAAGGRAAGVRPGAGQGYEPPADAQADRGRAHRHPHLPLRAAQAQDEAQGARAPRPRGMGAAGRRPPRGRTARGASGRGRARRWTSTRWRSLRRCARPRSSTLSTWCSSAKRAARRWSSASGALTTRPTTSCSRTACRPCAGSAAWSWSCWPWPPARASCRASPSSRPTSWAGARPAAPLAIV